MTSYLVQRLQVPQRHVISRRYTSRNVETIPHLPTSKKWYKCFIGQTVKLIGYSNMYGFSAIYAPMQNAIYDSENGNFYNLL